MRKAAFWIACGALLASVVAYSFNLVHSSLVSAIVGGAGALSILYILNVTEKSSDRKFAAWWGKHWDGCDQEEITELNEHLDNLVVACNDNDGPNIALSRKWILEVVAEIQANRRTHRK